MAQMFFTLVTEIGAAKLANATVLGTKVNLTHIAVGDGNDHPITPLPTMEALVHEVHRVSINNLSVDSGNASLILVEMVIPPEEGGFTVHEVGVFDEQGDLFAVASFPATYKPTLEEGSGRELSAILRIQVSSTASISLKIDPTVVLATKKDIEKHDADASAHGLDVLTTQMASLIPTGVVVMWSGMVDTIPVGWALCDGTQGTPDLRNVFILGAGDVAPGTCGGTDTHGHTVTVNATTAVNNAATLSVAQLASHTHSITPGNASSGSTATYRDGGEIGTRTLKSGATGGNQAHNHTQKAHAHAASADAVSNMPPYYALCFIMKL